MSDTAKMEREQLEQLRREMATTREVFASHMRMTETEGTVSDALARLAERAAKRGLEIPELDLIRLANLSERIRAWGQHDMNGVVVHDEDTDTWDGVLHRGTKHEVRLANVPDLEGYAFDEAVGICARLGLTLVHQTDPRGCALHIARPEDEMTESNCATRGLPINLLA